MGQALPAAPTEMLYPEGATVVIEGPSTTDEAGNRVEGTVMVGRRQDDADTDWGDRSQGHGALPGQSHSSERHKYNGREEGSTTTNSKKKSKRKFREEP